MTWFHTGHSETYYIFLWIVNYRQSSLNHVSLVEPKRWLFKWNYKVFHIERFIFLSIFFSPLHRCHITNWNNLKANIPFNENEVLKIVFEVIYEGLTTFFHKVNIYKHVFNHFGSFDVWVRGHTDWEIEKKNNIYLYLSDSVSVFVWSQREIRKVIFVEHQHVIQATYV